MKFTITLCSGLIGIVFAITPVVGSAQTAVAPPPSIGENTKGEVYIKEAKPIAVPEQTTGDAQTENNSEERAVGIDALLGLTEVKESRREGGSVSEIELSHSSGSKQYIRETDSDGKLETTSDSIEETPNLAKWRLGSW